MRQSTAAASFEQGARLSSQHEAVPPRILDASHLDPEASDYSLTPFTDKCMVTIVSGSGGHGCVSFLREKYIPDGPANGGDGGSGGSIYIKAVRAETSLYKLARRSRIAAQRGGHGKGKNQGGHRGGDALITVPVGTVVREIERHDPVAEELEARRLRKRARQAASEDGGDGGDDANTPLMAKFVTYPGSMSLRDEAATASSRLKLPFAQFNRPGPQTPPAPIYLDLARPTDAPVLLAAGAHGGLGNPHFVTPEVFKPKVASKGNAGVRIALHLELKVLADVGLVGLPNAGKSTLLRALTNSRTRVGSWEFTTLQPSIGTVVLDDFKGRPRLEAFYRDPGTGAATPERRTSFTIADIPGLIEEAHLDKGLGLGFLRHVERAQVLCFVLDLARPVENGPPDAVRALRALWREVAEYEAIRAREHAADTQRRLAAADVFAGAPLPEAPPAPVTSKPWLVVATKADLAGTEATYAALGAYLRGVEAGSVEHPAGPGVNVWRGAIRVHAVSALRAEGTQAIPRSIVELLS